jgi:hypothetical protein
MGKISLIYNCDDDLSKRDYLRESQMKRVLLLLAVLSFALPAVADSIVYLNGTPASYAARIAVNGSGPLNYIGGQGLLTNGAHESLDVDSHWSGAALHMSTGFSGDFTHVLHSAQTDKLTARYTEAGNGGRITNGYYVQKFILSYAGGFENAWKVKLSTGYVIPHKHRPLAAPEPETLSLLGTGLVFIGGVVRRKL